MHDAHQLDIAGTPFADARGYLPTYVAHTSVTTYGSLSCSPCRSLTQLRVALTVQLATIASTSPYSGSRARYGRLTLPLTSVHSNKPLRHPAPSPKSTGRL